MDSVVFPPINSCASMDGSGDVEILIQSLVRNQSNQNYLINIIRSLKHLENEQNNSRHDS